MDNTELKNLRKKILTGTMKRWYFKVDEGSDNFLKENLGYFGEIGIISIGGMKTIVECDPRDAIVKPMLAGWYDDVSWTGQSYEKWSRDTRFVSDPNNIPAIIKKNGKFAMVGYYGQKDPETGLRVPYYNKWYDSISTKYRRQKFGDTWVTVYDVEKDGKKMMLTNKGMEICIDVDVTLKEVKDWTKEDILHKWIEAGRPCTLIHGFRYKGASAHLINQSEALKRIKTHSFGVGYYSMEWTVFNGMAVLQFAEYSESDML